ncbi:MAG TPA: UTRA domain-containing protein [Streptosporangiaceae bacterium]|nr:UTRA domain-containing protein [Streptosporangiaceae bacterium]
MPHGWAVYWTAAQVPVLGSAADTVTAPADRPGCAGRAGCSATKATAASITAATPAASQVLRRSRLARWDHEAAEIVTWWIPAHLAEGTGLAQQEPLRGGVRTHLAHRTGRRIDHVVERVSARHPDAKEAKLLGIAKTAPVLAVSVTAREASGIPVVVLDIAMPGDRQELEDAYQVN